MGGVGRGKILLYFRFEGFSEQPSPSIEETDSLVNQQNFYYTAICDSIGRDFSEKVTIYLYNRDEAEKHIGTDGGGHAIPKLNTIYYTYLPEQREHTDPYGIENPLMGAHELVHVITHRTLGYPGTKLMSEGYANWLDGCYAGYRIEEIVRHYRDEEPAKIMSPEQLLTETSISESVYYPNCGIFIRFLVRRYGVEAVNSLFTVPAEAFRDAFDLVSPESWESMTVAYMNHITAL
jgi:hypothetical protein